jgi:hypothetical protein
MRDGDKLAVPQLFASTSKFKDHPGGISMLRTRISIAAAVLLSAAIVSASAQQMAPPASPAPDAPKMSAPDTPKMSRFKLTREKIKEMRAKWKENRPKLKACRAEVRKQGLTGDDRWFFISDCMAKA